MSDNTKKLVRSNDDRVLAGVCGGLADYFNVDATIIRVLFILFAVFVGGGFLAYIILWIVMPQAAVGPAGINITEEKSPPTEE